MIDELVSINDNNRFAIEEKERSDDNIYREIKSDENWSSIVKVLDEQVQNDIKLEQDVKNILNKAKIRKDASNVRLKDAILKTFPDFCTNPELKSKFCININIIMTLFFNFSIVTEFIRERMKIYWLKSSTYFLMKAENQLLASGESSVSDPSLLKLAICKQAETLIDYRIKRVFGLIKKQNEPTTLLLKSGDAKQNEPTLLLKSGDAKDEEDEDDTMEENEVLTEFNFSISNNNHQACIVICRKNTNKQFYDHQDLNISEQWPKECHILNDVCFQKYLLDWLKSKDFPSKT